MNNEQLRNLDTIIKTYGKEPQVDMAIEECSELIKALLKFRRKCSGLMPENNEEMEVMRELHKDVVDEIADVSIMIAQLQIMYNCMGEVEEQIDFKIRRQMARIEAKKHE